MDKLFLVGHGVGAHICGAIGREFSSEKHLRLKRITGLDPVGMMIFVVLWLKFYMTINAMSRLKLLLEENWMTRSELKLKSSALGFRLIVAYL